MWQGEEAAAGVPVPRGGLLWSLPLLILNEGGSESLGMCLGHLALLTRGHLHGGAAVGL